MATQRSADAVQESVLPYSAVIERLLNGWRPAPQDDGRMFWYIPNSPHLIQIQVMSDGEARIMRAHLDGGLDDD